MQTSESHPSASLALLFRGDAFRAGLHFHRTGALAAANPEPQLLAMASHIQHVVRPATQLGWRLATLFDVVIPPRFEAKFDQASRPLNILAKRIVYVRKAPNQMTSVVNSLEWALPLLEERASSYKAMLMLRIDIEFKIDLPLPPPDGVSATSPLGVAFFHPQQDLHLRGPARAVDRVSLQMCDLLMLIPRGRDAWLRDKLAEHIKKKGPYQSSLHQLPQMFGRQFTVKSLISGSFDSNPELEQNPLYKIANRPERSTDLPPHPFFARKAAVMERLHHNGMAHFLNKNVPFTNSSSHRKAAALALERYKAAGAGVAPRFPSLPSGPFECIDGPDGFYTSTRCVPGSTRPVPPSVSKRPTPSAARRAYLAARKAEAALEVD